MHRFFLPPESSVGARLALSQDDARHAATVLRIDAGEEVEILDGAGHRLHGRVASVHKRTVLVDVLDTQTAPPPTFSLVLAPALAKPKAMEWILQKAVELGATRIEPLMTARSVSRPAADEIGDKQSRWQTIVIEALKQCGAAWLTRVAPARALEDWLRDREPTDLTLVASLHAGAVLPRVAIEGFARQYGRHPASIAILVGPEGDFTPAELEAIVRSGARPVTLGDRVLRCETAALAALAILQHEVAAASVR